MSYLSKIIENTVHNQLSVYLKQHEILPENQSAYRENHSTETTICTVMNDLVKIVDDGNCGILVILDLTAAFDTVDHNFLLDDLKSIGIEGWALKWFESYLFSGQMTVLVSNEKSETRSLERGVPQGSILGPTLFNIYTIQLSEIFKEHDPKSDSTPLVRQL